MKQKGDYRYPSSAGQGKKKGSGVETVAAGCLVQKYVQELFGEIPEIDGLMGTGQVDGLAAALEHVLPMPRKVCLCKRQGRATSDFEERRLITTAGPSYLKIAEGCNNRCILRYSQIRGPAE